MVFDISQDVEDLKSDIHNIYDKLHVLKLDILDKAEIDSIILTTDRLVNVIDSQHKLILEISEVLYRQFGIKLVETQTYIKNYKLR